MADLATPRMTVDEFLVWAEGQDGRWELQDGAPVSMCPERVAHTETKGEAYSALNNAIAVARAPCRALTEGAAVRIDTGTVLEPDVLVYCGPRLPADSLEVSSPVIVVEAPSLAPPRGIMAPSSKAISRCRASCTISSSTPSEEG